MELGEIMEATRSAVTNLEGGGPGEEVMSDVRRIVMEELGLTRPDEVDVDDLVRRVSMKVSERITKMIWPEKALEVMRESARREVDREALMREVVNETLHLLKQRNG